ncbi:hypothetical protein, partial [Treponema sp. R6D11]
SSDKTQYTYNFNWDNNLKNRTKVYTLRVLETNSKEEYVGTSGTFQIDLSAKKYVPPKTAEIIVPTKNLASDQLPSTPPPITKKFFQDSHGSGHKHKTKHHSETINA